MKNTFFYLTLIALLFGSACTPENKEELKPENIFEINVDPSCSNWFWNDSKGAIAWLSDDNGKVLIDTTLHLNDNIIIQRPNGYNGERFSLHIFKYNSSSNYYELTTYSNIQSGKVNLKELAFDYGNVVNEVEISFTDVPAYEWHWFSGGSLGSLSPIPTKNYSVQESNDWYFFGMKNGNEGYYKFIDDVKSNSQLSVSLSDMASLTKHELSYSKGESPFITLEGYHELNNYYGNRTTLWLEFSNTIGSGPINFFVPDTEERIKDFKTYISLSELIGEFWYQYSYSSFGNTIPSTMKYMDATLDVSNLRADNLIINTTGEFDMIDFSLRNLEDNAHRQWQFYGASGSDIIFPELPEKIENNYPMFSKELLLNQNTNYYVRLDDQDNCNGYDERVGRILLRDDLAELDGITENLKLTNNGKLK